MLKNLIQNLNNIECKYTLISLSRIDIRCSNYTTCIIIRGNKYNIYEVNDAGEILNYWE